jgi:hypothetical protein
MQLLLMPVPITYYLHTTLLKCDPALKTTRSGDTKSGDVSYAHAIHAWFMGQGAVSHVKLGTILIRRSLHACSQRGK